MKSNPVRVLLLFVVALSGCSGSPESAVKEGLKTLNDMTDSLHAIANGAPLKEAGPKLRKLVIRFRELKYKLDRLDKPQPGDQEELARKYLLEYQDAEKRFHKALKKAMATREAEQIIEQIFNEELPDYR
jgi:hypothetical protein